MGWFGGTDKNTTSTEYNTTTSGADNGAISATNSTVNVTDGGLASEALDFAGMAFEKVTEAVGVYAGRSIEAVANNAAESIRYANTTSDERSNNMALLLVGSVVAVALVFKG